MATSASSAFLFDHATRALVRRGRISPQAASAALLHTAHELGVQLGDLAALVLAAEHQQRVQQPARPPQGAGRTRTPPLFVVGTDDDQACDTSSSSWSQLPGRSCGHVDPHPRQDAPAAAWAATDPQLSAREYEVITLLAQGLSNEQVAAAAHLSVNSVKTYLRMAYRKIGVKTRVQALLWAIDHGIRLPGAGRTWERPPSAEESPESAASAESPGRLVLHP